MTAAMLITLFLLSASCRTDETQRPGTTGITTITLAGSPSFQQVYESLTRQFQEEYPNIQVQYMPLTAQQANLSLREQAALADVLLLEGQPPTAEAAAVFLNLTPLLTVDPTFDAADFWPGLMAACQAAGVQVGLPFRANASLILFDKAAFDAVGLPHPEPGWSWEDFRHAARTLTTREDEQAVHYGFVDGGNPLSLLAPLVDGLIGQSGDTLDGQRLAAELDWYISLADEKVILSESGVPVNSLLNQRQVGMWVGSQFGLNATRTALGDDLGVISFPTATGMTQNNPVSAGCALISAGTNQSQSAWTFLDYLSRQPLFTAGPLPVTPARPSVAQSSDYWAQLEPETATAVRAALEQGWYRRAEMPELVAIGDALTQALAGETSLAESLPGTVEIQPTAPPPRPDTAIAVATPRVTPTPTAPDGDVLLVEYYSAGGGGHHDEALTALAQAFNDMQVNFEVRILREPGRYDGTYIEYLAGAGDCLAYGGTVAGDQTAFKDNFYSLRPLLDSEPDSFREDFDPYWWERNQIDGELYALPGPVRPYVVYYNVQLLAELGLDPPSSDWTTGDFWALAEAATRTEGNRPTYGFAPYELWPANLIRFVPQAQYFFDLNTQPPAPAFNDPAVIRTLSWLAAMVEAGVMFPSDQFGARTSWDYDNALRIEQARLISQGQVAMWVDQVHAWRPNWPIQISVAPYPQVDLLSPYSQEFTVSSFLISKRTADPTGCWEWIKFLSAQPDAFAGVPARYSVRRSPAWSAIVGEEAAVAYEATLARWQPSPEVWGDWPYSAWAWQYGAWWSDAVQDVFAGADPATVLRKTQLQAEIFYDCISAYENPANAPGRACAEEADPNFWRGRSPPTP